MGFPICENLLAAGYRLAVYDVAREPVERLARKGALACQSHSDLVRASDVVFTMVPSDAVLVALVGGEDGLARTMRRGQTLIDMSTVSPLRSEQVALMLADSGCAYLRCPVSGSTANAAAATLAIFCSGDRAAYDAHKPVLDHIGSRTSYCGAAEEARVLKLLVNIIVGVTPALVGEGASAIAGGSAAGAADLDWAEQILGAVGSVVRVPEAQLDAVTGLAGSGPAYLFLIAEALTDAGVLAGLSRANAEALVSQLFVGSAALLADRGDPAALRAMVTSPGGTTAAGLRALESAGVRAAMLDAVMAATARSRELGH